MVTHSAYVKTSISFVYISFYNAGSTCHQVNNHPFNKQERYMKQQPKKEIKRGTIEINIGSRNKIFDKSEDVYKWAKDNTYWFHPKKRKKNRTSSS